MFINYERKLLKNYKCDEIFATPNKVYSKHNIS